MNIEATIATAVISCIVSFFLGGTLTGLTSRLKGAAKHEKALQKAVSNILRDKIIEQHEKYTARGYCPIYAKQSATSNYEAYHELGGNGTCTKLYEDIMALPEALKDDNERRH